MPQGGLQRAGDLLLMLRLAGNLDGDLKGNRDDTEGKCHTLLEA